MAEGTSLLRMHTAYTCIVGSNPTVSASILKKPLIFKGFFLAKISTHIPTHVAIGVEVDQSVPAIL